MTRIYNISTSLGTSLGRNLGRKSPLPGICEFWCSVVPFRAPDPQARWLTCLACSTAAVLQGAVTVYVGEVPPGNRAGKVVTPVLRGAGERTPDRPHGSGPFGISIFYAERAVVIRAADIPGRAPPDCILAALAA